MGIELFIIVVLSCFATDEIVTSNSHTMREFRKVSKEVIEYVISDKEIKKSNKWKVNYE